MIEKLENTIIEYQTELQELTYDEIEKKEEDSFTINGIRLDEIAGIVNEKIKIADTFTHYIIEKCKPNQVKILRKFIEEYERKIDLLKSGMLNFDEMSVKELSYNLLTLIFFTSSADKFALSSFRFIVLPT